MQKKSYTEMGKIANAIALAEEGKTPLEIKLEQLSKILTKLVIGVCVIIFAYNLITQYFMAENAQLFDVALHSFITAIALAVAAIPEGLVAVMTIVLSIYRYLTKNQRKHCCNNQTDQHNRLVWLN